MRKVLITLISTLNASCPDFDFSGAAPADFCPTHAAAALSAIRDHVSESALGGASTTTADAAAPSFHARVLAALNAHVELTLAPAPAAPALGTATGAGSGGSACDVYEYMCDIETGEEDMAPLWSLNYFFYNRRLKKIVFFTAWATRCVFFKQWSCPTRRELDFYFICIVCFFRLSCQQAHELSRRRRRGLGHE